MTLFVLWISFFFLTTAARSRGHPQLSEPSPNAALEEKKAMIQILTERLNFHKDFFIPRAIFYAQQTKPSCINCVVTYDNVTINESNRFYASRGTFVAPASGIYTFHFSGLKDSNRSNIFGGTVKLNKNGRPVAHSHIQKRRNSNRSILEGKTEWDIFNIHSTIRLKENDRVYVTIEMAGLFADEDNPHFTRTISFTGFLVQMDISKCPLPRFTPTIQAR